MGRVRLRAALEKLDRPLRVEMMSSPTRDQPLALPRLQLDGVVRWAVDDRPVAEGRLTRRGAVLKVRFRRPPPFDRRTRSTQTV